LCCAALQFVNDLGFAITRVADSSFQEIGFLDDAVKAML